MIISSDWGTMSFRDLLGNGVHVDDKEQAINNSVSSRPIDNHPLKSEIGIYSPTLCGQSHLEALFPKRCVI